MTRPNRLTAGVGALALCAGLFVWSPAVASGAEAGEPAEVVVKVDRANGHTVDEVVGAYPVEVDRAVLASRGIYLLRSTTAEYAVDGKESAEKAGAKLAKELEHSDAVVYAEANYTVDFADTRFHAWPDGIPEDAGSSAAVWSEQPAATELGLADAHTRSTGEGVTVAVLDTGVDAGHETLDGKLVDGWDYVDDDGDPADVASDAEGNAYGHGTFVSGLVTLVAPDANILPARVLGTDGRGTVFAVAEAVYDATDAGADIVNLSFGMPAKLHSSLVRDAVKYAKHRGAVVVAAAGNSGGSGRNYPAAEKDVVAVAALGEEPGMLSGFTSRGKWVSFAAPGQRVAGPVPGGRYAWWSGTSVAAPFVSGQLALLRAAADEKDKTKRLLEMIEKTARKLDQGKENETEHGGVAIAASIERITR